MLLETAALVFFFFLVFLVLVLLLVRYSNKRLSVKLNILKANVLEMEKADKRLHERIARLERAEGKTREEPLPRHEQDSGPTEEEKRRSPEKKEEARMHVS